MKVAFIFVTILVIAVQGQDQDDLPEFLVGAPKAVIDEWNGLVKKFDDETETQIKADMDSFVSKHPELKDKYATFVKNADAQQKEMEAKHKARIASLSPAAQEADKKLTAISNDSSLTLEQKHAQIDKIFKELPKEVVAELDKANEQ